MTVRSMKRIYAIAFSEKGFALAQKIADTIGAEARRSGYAPDGGGSPMDVHQWTAEHFNEADALIYVGAAGIAVRAIAPHLVNKISDPAVLNFLFSTDSAVALRTAAPETPAPMIRTSNM